MRYLRAAILSPFCKGKARGIRRTPERGDKNSHAHMHNASMRLAILTESLRMRTVVMRHGALTGLSSQLAVATPLSKNPRPRFARRIGVSSPWKPLHQDATCFPARACVERPRLGSRKPKVDFIGRKSMPQGNLSAGDRYSSRAYVGAMNFFGRSVPLAGRSVPLARPAPDVGQAVPDTAAASGRADLKAPSVRREPDLHLSGTGCLTYICQARGA
jgi:hypothetical protein